MRVNHVVNLFTRYICGLCGGEGCAYCDGGYEWDKYVERRKELAEWLRRRFEADELEDWESSIDVTVMEVLGKGRTNVMP